jgi:hypothetical protein
MASNTIWLRLDIAEHHIFQQFQLFIGWTDRLQQSYKNWIQQVQQRCRQYCATEMHILSPGNFPQSNLLKHVHISSLDVFVANKHNGANIP